MASSSELLDRLEVFGTRLGLDSTRRLLTWLGEPQLDVSAVLVAGTNGKGSTAALLSSFTTAAGYRTGLYTSPHLETVRERVRVNGESISERDLSDYVSEVVSVADKIGEGSATYFEVLTVAALLHFSRSEIDLAILEVGLGGRLDATNATEPVLSVITEIGLDHREHLGESLSEIAREKGGILRAGGAAVAWVTDPEARSALERHGRELGARLRFAQDECAVRRRPGRSELVELRTAVESYTIELPIPGAHQLANLALAVCGAESLAAAGWSRIDSEAVRRGAAASRWPGRLEWVDLGAAGRVLLDGAHNPDGATALAGYLADAELDYTLVFGVLRDKAAAEMLPRLAERAASVILTAPESPRARDPHDLTRLLPHRDAEIVLPSAVALDRALQLARPVVVCGSLYLVGEARSVLTRRFGVPRPAAEVPTYEPA